MQTNMESSDKASKLQFGTSVFLCFVFGSSVILFDHDLKNGIFFLVGVYNVWQHGFVKDNSEWKLRPIFPVIGVVVLLAVVLNFKINSRPKIKQQEPLETGVSVLEQLIDENQKFPISMGNNDSILSIKAKDDNTLEYTYKLNMDVKDIDSLEKDEFIVTTKKLLIDQIASRSFREINLLRESSITFSHVYLDSNLNLLTIVVVDSGEY